MRILQLCKYFPPVFGGIEQVAYDISDGFKNKCDKKVDVLCADKKTAHEVDWGYDVFRASFWKVVFSTPLSIKYISQWRVIGKGYDIVHVHLPNPLAVLAILLFPVKAKIVVHWHSDIVKQKKLLVLFKPLQDWLLRKADKIIVTSPVYGRLSPSLQCFQHKIICIPIGIEPNRLPANYAFDSELRSQFEGKKVVFALGRLVYYKGFSYLIDAAMTMPDNVVIIIGGEGELFDELQSLIVKKKLQHKVFLTGGIEFDKLSSYYKLCDVFCLPSIHESEAFGVVQLEAMSYKKPVVSTDIKRSGVSWVNKDGYSGVVVTPQDSEALARGIISVLSDVEHFSEQAYDRYVNSFTKGKMIESINKLYENLE